jgi:ribosomal protein L37AE/L43A
MMIEAAHHGGTLSEKFAADLTCLHTCLLRSWPVGFNGETAMTKATYFVRACPTCGRMLEIRIELLGKEVSCQHCNAHFEATAWNDHREKDRHLDRLMARADQYLLKTELLNAEWQSGHYDNQVD